ncbi:MAG: hypothetical protein QF662_08715, partial [Phycisphaerae bacterium]|nr:hypothetical protein [Phycisphaerae bacterium]
KSKDERRIERNIQIQKTLGLFTGQIKKLKKQEGAYIAAAQDARRARAPQQEEIAKKALKATLAQRRRLDQQLLTLKIAVQMKEQTETHAEFAKALKGVSKTIADMFGTADMVQTQKDFEMAMARAQSMEQRVDLFLSSASTTMFGETIEEGEIVTDDEIDRLVAAEAAQAEGAADAEIDKGLKEIRDELARDQ